MVGDVAPGVAAVLGALVGGGATIGVNLLNLRSQRDLATRDRVAQVEDIRRDASVRFLTRAMRFMDLARALTEVIDAADEEYRRDLYRRYLDEWTQFATSSAAVQIAGPAGLADLAVKFRRKVGDYSEFLDERYHDPIRTEPSDTWNDALERKAALARKARDEFVASAQRLSEPHPD